MQISRSICAEKKKKAIVRSSEEIFSKSVSRVSEAKGRKNHKGKHGAGSCTHIDIDNAKIFGIRGYRVYKREKCGSEAINVNSSSEIFRFILLQV